jgi:hypothetical protein
MISAIGAGKSLHQVQRFRPLNIALMRPAAKKTARLRESAIAWPAPAIRRPRLGASATSYLRWMRSVAGRSLMAHAGIK